VGGEVAGRVTVEGRAVAIRKDGLSGFVLKGYMIFAGC
jgi:hypothetical protein